MRLIAERGWRVVISQMHRETLGSAECCLKGLKSVIMRTSQRRLPPQLRVENEKAEEEVRTGREGGREGGWVPDFSLPALRGISLCAAREGSFAVS